MGLYFLIGFFALSRNLVLAENMFELPLSREEALLESIAGKIEKLDTESIGPAAREIAKASEAIRKVAPNVDFAAQDVSAASLSINQSVNVLSPKIESLIGRVDGKLDNIDKIGKVSEMLNRKLSGIDFKKTGQVIDQHFNKVEELWERSINLIEEKTSLQSIAMFAVVSQVATLASQEVFQLVTYGMKTLIAQTYEYFTEEKRDRERAALYKNAFKFHKELTELRHKSLVALGTEIYLIQVGQLILPPLSTRLQGLDFEKEILRSESEKKFFQEKLNHVVGQRLESGKRLDDENRIMEQLFHADKKIGVYQYFQKMQDSQQGFEKEDWTIVRGKTCEHFKKSFAELSRIQAMLSRWESELIRGFFPFLTSEEKALGKRQKELSRDLQKHQREKDVGRLTSAIYDNAEAYEAELRTLYGERARTEKERKDYCSLYIKSYRERVSRKQMNLTGISDLGHELEMVAIVRECENRMFEKRLQREQELEEKIAESQKIKKEKIKKIKEFSNYLGTLSPHLLEDPTLSLQDFALMVEQMNELMRLRACGSRSASELGHGLIPELAYCAHMDYRMPSKKSAYGLTFQEHVQMLKHQTEAFCRLEQEAPLLREEAAKKNNGQVQSVDSGGPFLPPQHVFLEEEEGEDINLNPLKAKPF
jgi:hypothetical protein